VFINMDITNN